MTDSPQPPHSPGRVADQLLAGMAAAWNVHDMAAFAGLFHQDAAFVNVNGTYARGRAEIERLHATVHASFYRSSAITLGLQDSRAAAADVIAAHAVSELRGDERAPGQVRQAIMTLVIEQRHGPWQISAAQNTAVVTAGSTK